MSNVAPTATTERAAGRSVGERRDGRTGPVQRWRYTLPGLVGALVFVCLSLSPSLLPRTGVIQGLVCGITGAIGYGVGVLVAWMWRGVAPPAGGPPRPPPPPSL